MNDYYSHQEFLLKELDKLKSKEKVNCLEFGTGNGSSSLFKNFADIHPNSQIRAFESDYQWFISMSSKYQSQNYKFHYVFDWTHYLDQKKFNNIYDLVFIDQKPWEARIKTIEKLHDRVKIFILHDYDFYNKGVYDKDIYSIGNGSFFHQKFSKNFTMESHFKILPPTLILRNLNIK